MKSSMIVLLCLALSVSARPMAPTPFALVRRAAADAKGKGADKGKDAADAGKNAGGKNNGGDNGGDKGGDAQTSKTLLDSVIAKGFAKDGQQVKEDNQVASLTSTNNYINFCVGQTLTDGQQKKGGSCNPAPMGQIPSTANMPSSKFTNPKNLDTIKANQAFTISMAIKGMKTGNFVNAANNYFSAPQQVEKGGSIIGHSHVVVQKVSSLTSTEVLDPQKFDFFKGLNTPAEGGVLSAEVTGGLKAGVYKLSSINTAANHQPALVPVAQHGSLDDAIYFTVTADGKADAGAAGGKDDGKGAAAAGGKGGDKGADTASSSAGAAATSAAGGKGAAKGADAGGKDANAGGKGADAAGKGDAAAGKDANAGGKDVNPTGKGANAGGKDAGADGKDAGAGGKNAGAGGKNTGGKGDDGKNQ